MDVSVGPLGTNISYLVVCNYATLGSMTGVVLFNPCVPKLFDGLINLTVKHLHLILIQASALDFLSV